MAICGYIETGTPLLGLAKSIYLWFRYKDFYARKLDVCVHTCSLKQIDSHETKAKQPNVKSIDFPLERLSMTFYDKRETAGSC